MPQDHINALWHWNANLGNFAPGFNEVQGVNQDQINLAQPPAEPNLVHFFDDPAVEPPPVVGVEQGAQEFINQQFEEIMAQKKNYKEIFGSQVYKATKGVRSASQLSDEYQDLARQIVDLQASIHQESGELARVLEDISRQVEVVRDIGSLVHQRLTNLQQVATQLEMWRQTLLLPGSPELAKAVPEAHSPPAEAVPPAVAGLKQVAPGLWQQDLG